MSAVVLAFAIAIGNGAHRNTGRQSECAVRLLSRTNEDVDAPEDGRNELSRGA
jgi:hypothetical protein